MSLVQIKHSLRRLSLDQLRKLDEWLHELIRRAEEANRAEKSSSRKQTVVEQSLENKTYRLESIRCGKENCNRPLSPSAKVKFIGDDHLHKIIYTLCRYVDARIHIKR